MRVLNVLLRTSVLSFSQHIHSTRYLLTRNFPKREFSMAAPGESVITSEELHSFVRRCMTSVGTREKHAEALADLLVAADVRGHYSHGLNRLEIYVNDIKTGMTRSDTEPEIVKETMATAFVEGNNVLGPVVGKFCIDLAIQKAKNVGIGWVVAKGSNHFGIAGWYGLRAADQGMVGMAFTNTSPLMVPTRGKKPMLGTNPLACVAPAQDGDSFALDMATTAVALGKLELNERKNMEIPLGWGCDQNGKPTENPSNAKGLMPLGGTEECSGYKGYGLAFMVELLTGIMGGAEFGPNIRQWKSNERIANLGQCFVAIDPSVFADGFSDRLSDLMSSLRNAETAEGEKEILVAGDPERKHISLCEKLGGIPYHPNQVEFAEKMAAKLNIEPPKILK